MQPNLWNTKTHLKFVSKLNTAQRMKFSTKDFFSKCDQSRSFLRIWSHLLKKSLVGIFIFLCSVSSYDAHRFIEELGKNFNKDDIGFIAGKEEVDQL